MLSAKTRIFLSLPSEIAAVQFNHKSITTKESDWFLPEVRLGILSLF